MGVGAMLLPSAGSGGRRRFLRPGRYSGGICPEAGTPAFKALTASLSLAVSGVLLWLGLHEYGLRNSAQWSAGGARTPIGVVLVLFSALFFFAGLTCCFVTNDTVYELQDE